MSIQKKVVLSILFTGFIALTIGLFVTYYQVKDVLIEAIGRDFAEIAKKSAERFDAAVKDEITTFQRLSEESAFIMAVKGGNKETIGVYLTHYLKHAEEREEHLALFVVDEQGKIIGDGELRTGKKIDQSDEVWWKVVYNSGLGKLYASDVYKDEVSGKKAFDLGIPVFDSSGRVIGGIKTIIIVDTFFRFIKETSFGRTGHGMLIDSEGTPLICSILPLVEHSMNKPLIELITGIGGGWAIARDDAHGGKNSVIGFSPVQYLNSLGPESLGGHRWYTFVRQVPEETFAPVNRLMLKVLLLESVIVLSICAFGVHIVRRFLLRPINIIYDGVERIGKGNLDYRMDIHTGDELESLANGFNKMGEALKGFYCNLEEKIKERASALKASETKYRALMEQAYDAIFLVNPENGQIMEVNLQAEMLTGYFKEELLRLKYWELYQQQMVKQALEQFNKGVKRGFTTLHEVPLKRKDGKPAWVDVSARLVEYSNVKVYHAVMRDITERKKEEEKLSMTSEQLARSTMVMLDQDAKLDAIRQEMKLLIKQVSMSDILGVLYKAVDDILGIKRIAIFEHAAEVISCNKVYGTDNKGLHQLKISVEENDAVIYAIRDFRVIRKGDVPGKSQLDKYFEDWIIFPIRDKDSVIGAFVADMVGTKCSIEMLQCFVDILSIVLEKENLIKKVKST